jgi:hypothetical protein
VTAKDTPAGDVFEAAPAGYIEYEINVERVLRDELPGVLGQVELAPLTAEAVLTIPLKAKGAYVLYENGHPVYAGKTDTRHGFRDRLTRHSDTIQHRQGFDHSTIGFKAVRIMVFSNFDVEAILISELRRLDSSALAWNYSGFGSNDPGRNRERQAPASFDVERPINIDRPLDFLRHGFTSVLDLLLALKSGLPYVFRYETSHEELRAAPPVIVPNGQPTFREMLNLVLQVLPAGWRVTVFPGRVIFYKENETYPHAREYLPA